MNKTRLVLFAIPKDWDEESYDELIKNAGFSTLKAFSYPDALEVIQSQKIFAVVMISDWAMGHDDVPGLMSYLKNKTPTISLITTKTYRNNDEWLDELYDRPKHEYQHMPADLDGILVLLNRIVE